MVRDLRKISETSKQAIVSNWCLSIDLVSIFGLVLPFLWLTFQFLFSFLLFSYLRCFFFNRILVINKVKYIAYIDVIKVEQKRFKTSTTFLWDWLFGVRVLFGALTIFIGLFNDYNKSLVYSFSAIYSNSYSFCRNLIWHLCHSNSFHATWERMRLLRMHVFILHRSKSFFALSVSIVIHLIVSVCRFSFNSIRIISILWQIAIA